ncbi:MAG: alpha/beta fold hydrolase [Chloroflexota bacterium]
MAVATPTERWLEVDGLRLKALDWGTAGKPPVLLLHGMAMYSWTWEQNALAWNDVFHVVAVDQRGHGDSDRPPRGTYLTEIMAADAIKMADALGWDRFSIVGQSMGGHNGMQAAMDHPDRVERLVISDMEPLFQLHLMDYMRKADALPVYDSYDQFVEEAAKRNPRPPIELHRSRAMRALKKLPDGRLTPKYDLYAPKDWAPLDLWPRLREITCPTLLVRGAESPVLRQDHAERMVKAIPDCQLVVVPGAGHGIGSDNPVMYERCIRQFLLGETVTDAVPS